MKNKELILIGKLLEKSEELGWNCLLKKKGNFVL